MAKLTVSLPRRSGKGKSIRVAWNQESCEQAVPNGAQSVVVEVPDNTGFVLTFDGVRQAFKPNGAPVSPVAVPLFGIGPAQEIETPAAPTPRRRRMDRDVMDQVIQEVAERDIPPKQTTTSLGSEEHDGREI